MSSAPAADALAFQTVLFSALNDVRKAAGVGPLTLEGKQSEVNQKLVPHFFEAAFSGRDEVVDLIGLGVLAGWDVNGLIRDGGVYSGIVTSTRSPARFLAYALESPLGRSILLGEGALRLRFRESTARPAPLVPGQVYPVEVELDNLALRLQPGDRLRLILSSSNYPKYAKNLNDGGAMYHDGAGVPAWNQIFGGGERPSALVLPVSGP